MALLEILSTVNKQWKLYLPFTLQILYNFDKRKNKDFLDSYLTLHLQDWRIYQSKNTYQQGKTAENYSDTMSI